MFKVPNQHRLTNHPTLGSDDSYGNNGFFIIKHPKVKDYELRCMASDGEGWEHVSVSVGPKGEKATRNPTWIEMCIVKDLFWTDEDCVVQYHPPKSQYVNHHPFCLHLWRPIATDIPVPDSILVGLKMKN